MWSLWKLQAWSVVVTVRFFDAAVYNFDDFCLRGTSTVRSLNSLIVLLVEITRISGRKIFEPVSTSVAASGSTARKKRRFFPHMPSCILHKQSLSLQNHTNYLPLKYEHKKCVGVYRYTPQLPNTNIQETTLPSQNPQFTHT